MNLCIHLLTFFHLTSVLIEQESQYLLVLLPREQERVTATFLKNSKKNLPLILIEVPLIIGHEKRYNKTTLLQPKWINTIIIETCELRNQHVTGTSVQMHPAPAI